MDMTMWDKIPEEMQLYLSRNGKHFNTRLCEFAVGLMRGKENEKEKEKENDKDNPITREQTESMLSAAGLDISDYAAPYDAVFVANMAKSDFLGSSLPDMAHVVKYVDDLLTDPDGYEGMVFNRWLADVAGKGVWVDWEKML